MKNPMNRRIFLRGLGGACVAAPFLGSIAEREAKSQAAAAPPPPKRLIVMFTHYGCLTTKFFPAKAHGQLMASDLSMTTLEPLAGYVDKMLVPRGLRAMNEWTSKLKRGQGNDPHTQVVGSYFTCQPVTPNTDNPFSFDKATKVNAKPMGPSLDHVIAKQRSPGGEPLFMRLGNKTESPQSAISYSAKTTSYPGLGQASQVFSSLTGLLDGDTPMNQDSYEVVNGRSVVDVLKDDLDTLDRIDMSQSDHQKLEAWKALLDDTTKVMASAQCNEEMATMLGATKANADKLKYGTVDTLATTISGTEDGADIYSNLAVLAAVCNANPVIFLKYPGNYVYSGLGVTLESHAASHRLNDANMQGDCVDGVLGMLTKIQDYYAKKFLHLLDRLSSIDEGDGKLLDNCATVWFQEMSDGNAHNLNNLPIVQVGSCGGYFKTGWAVNLEGGAATMSSGNSEAQCKDGGKVDGASQETGTDATIGNAPINKYFCNLMNAMGVKAGADGFPAVGGTEEVRCYGMYDTTEDFIGGGTKPARIANPGEFAELKAGS